MVRESPDFAGRIIRTDRPPGGPAADRTGRKAPQSRGPRPRFVLRHERGSADALPEPGSRRACGGGALGVGRASGLDRRRTGEDFTPHHTSPSTVAIQCGHAPHRCARRATPVRSPPIADRLVQRTLQRRLRRRRQGRGAGIRPDAPTRGPGAGTTRRSASRRCTSSWAGRTAGTIKAAPAGYTAPTGPSRWSTSRESVGGHFGHE